MPYASPPYQGPLYPGAPASVSQVYTTGRRCSTGHIVVAWIFAGVTIGALLPWAIAATRGHKDVVAIALVNWLLGWTGIAWIICLVWSLTSAGTDVVVTANAGYLPSYPGYANQPGYSGAATATPAVQAGPYEQSGQYGQTGQYGQLSDQPYAQPYSYPAASGPSVSGWQPTQPLPSANPGPDWQLDRTRQAPTHDQDPSATRWDDRQDPR